MLDARAALDEPAAELSRSRAEHLQVDHGPKPDLVCSDCAGACEARVSHRRRAAGQALRRSEACKRECRLPVEPALALDVEAHPGAERQAVAKTRVGGVLEVGGAFTKPGAMTAPGKCSRSPANCGAGPTAAMRSPSTTTAPFSIGAPSTGSTQSAE